MRVTDLRPLRPTTGSRPASGASSAGGGFAGLLGADEAAVAAPAARSAPVVAVAPILPEPDAFDAAQGPSRGVAHARDLLDDLSRFHRALVAGFVPAATAQAMVIRLRSHADLPFDPQLQDIVAEIELRAAVELAKLGVTL
jgi:hypothetical protein